MNTGRESLHTHTVLSDGKLTHTEMFDLAESLGIRVIAFTDHDALPTSEVLEELEELKGRDTKWIIGIELTAGLPREVVGSASLHIIGLFVDPENIALREHCVKAQADRVRRMEVMVGGLSRLGFHITEEDCLDASGGESVGRPHIVEALSKYPENDVVMERIRKEMEEEGKVDPSVGNRYTLMMQGEVRHYPYTLLLSPTAFRSVYAEHSYMPDLDEAVSLIRDADGVAILAHYFTVNRKLSLFDLERILEEKRIDGAEVVYGLRQYATDAKDAIEKERKAVKEIVLRTGSLLGGGSDAHSEEDLRYYVDQAWFSNETVGLTQQIIESGRVSSRFSSLPPEGILGI